MRDLFSKLMIGSMVAGAALLVSACGSKTETTETNTVEMNSMEPAMEGSMNDVTAVDASMGSDANAMGNSMGNDMGSNMMESNSMGNAM